MHILHPHTFVALRSLNIPSDGTDPPWSNPEIRTDQGCTENVKLLTGTRRHLSLSSSSRSSREACRRRLRGVKGSPLDINLHESEILQQHVYRNLTFAVRSRDCARNGLLKIHVIPIAGVFSMIFQEFLGQVFVRHRGNPDGSNVFADAAEPSLRVPITDGPHSRTFNAIVGAGIPPVGQK